MSERIIDFNRKIEERKMISIVKRDNEIHISGWEGCMFFFFNLPLQKKEKKSIVDRIIEFIKGKNHAEIVAKTISEKMCKEEIFELVERISSKQSLEDSSEDLWNEIKDEILDAENFKYIFLKGDIFNPKSCVTFISSNILSIKNS